MSQRQSRALQITRHRSAKLSIFIRCYGHVSCAIPETTIVLAVICDIGIFGSTGAVACTETIPMKPLHCATPLGVMVGTEDDMLLLIGMGVIVGNGFPMLHNTGGEVAVMGAMLKDAVAVN